MHIWSEGSLKELYLNQKKSAHDIASLFGCSENKIHYWLKRYDITKRTISEAVYCKHNPNGDPFFIKTPTTREEAVLYGLGMGLYWGEGTKSNKTAIRLGNTDPMLIQTFINFLETFFGIKKSKLRFGLQIFSDMPAHKAKKFWQDLLGVPPSQFYKVIVTPSRSIGTYRQKTKHGVLTVYYNNKKLRDVLCGLVENYKKV